MDASTLNSMRVRYGMGLEDCKRAVEIANQRFDGDTHLGALWVHANGFAVNIKGDRAAWNDRWARNSEHDF